ncbi:MAG TPA: GDSL-type esterase/lipase family protein [Afipia sp.]
MPSRPVPPNNTLQRMRTERGPLTALAVAAALTLGIAAPASAQFFNFGGPPPPPRGGGFFSPFGDTFGPAPPPRPRVMEDFSRAPAAAKRDTPAERNVLVLGDAMADWLAYGLEDALSETPELGVVRRHKTVSGLIKYQPKGDPADWPAAARGILASEKPDVIVVMLGLNDRIAIKEPEKKAEAKPADKDKDTKGAKKDARGKPVAKPAETDAAKTGDKPDTQPDDEKNLADRAASKAPEADAASDDDDDKPAAVPDKTARSASGMSDFRDERWVELYTRKIEEMIAVLKTKGVPILWVGLPAVRGTKATSDMLFLNALYRDVAGKTGVTYVDIWDGFVDEAGRFLQQGPDFEGQIRRLRSGDGVYFTKAGARKLAHYTEREIRRVLASRTPVALPTESAPDNNAPNNAPLNPGSAGPRPLAGPVVPLVASSVGTDELLGGAGTRPASVDALAARTLVKGEPLAAPAGRADDFAWPRREVGTLDAPAGAAGEAAVSVQDGASATAKKKRAAPQNPARGFFDPGRMLPPRPPGTVGRSAEMPGFFR